MGFLSSVFRYANVKRLDTSLNAIVSSSSGILEFLSPTMLLPRLYLGGSSILSSSELVTITDYFLWNGGSINGSGTFVIDSK